MKLSKCVWALLMAALMIGCVQPSSNKTIVLRLDVAGIKNIETVGIRGVDKPLSWDYDMELKPIVKDSLYEGSFSLVTGYLFTEAKFTINGQFELKDKDNRKIMLGKGDTTVYTAKFDVAQENK